MHYLTFLVLCCFLCSATSKLLHNSHPFPRLQNAVKSTVAIALSIQFSAVPPSFADTLEAVPLANVKKDVVGEQIRQMAAILPNIGQPDVYYPDLYEGEWEVEQEVTGVVEKRKVLEKPLIVQGLEDKNLVSFRRVYSRYGDKVVFDRGVSTSNYLQKLVENDKTEKVIARFEVSNPNVVNVETSGKRNIEIRVTKRSVEDTKSIVNGNDMQDASNVDGAISYSEFSRVVESEGTGQPRLWGVRLLARYKQQSEGVITGLERLYVYDSDTLDLEPIEINFF